MDRSHFHKMDSLVFSEVKTDGERVWVELDVYLGKWDPPVFGIGAERGHRIVGIELAKASSTRKLQKFKRSRYQDLSGPRVYYPAWIEKESVLGVSDALERLGQDADRMKNELVLSGFCLVYHEDGFYGPYVGLHLMEWLFTHPGCHEHFLPFGRCEGTIIRYNFETEEWSHFESKDILYDWDRGTGL